MLKFLKYDPRADYMWSDSEDLTIIADIYQVNIKIITTKGPNDKEPTVNWIYPEASLKQFAELQNVEMNNLVLLHEHDSHFNLIVSGNSDLAKFGSLSHRFGFNILKENSKKTMNEEEHNPTSSEFVTLQQELKECRENKKIIEDEYHKCEKELRNKVEEVEKIKVELNDLKKIAINISCDFNASLI